jgi:hypothetical protein
MVIKKNHEQTDPMSLTTMSIFFISKGVITSFKPIYKCHEQEWGIFFHFSSRVPQFSSNLTSVFDNDGF